MYAAAGVERPHVMKKTHNRKKLATWIINPSQPPLARPTPYDISGLAMPKLG
jgi:hypothetical protein